MEILHFNFPEQKGVITMVKALLFSLASAVVTFLLYGWIERPVYKYLSYLSAVAFVVCDILCIVKLGFIDGM